MREAKPMSGPLLTRGYMVLMALGALGIVLITWRFFVGLGTATAMSDGYPLGLWIVFDVVTGTALACGGYALALLVYIFNRGRYHPLVRPAILTSALGYTIAGLSVAIDLGRPWNMWKIPLYIGDWNLNSALLEVALCIMAYVVVLWIELAPAFLERWKTDGPLRLRRVAERTLPLLDKLLIWTLALGMLLPTMHQSSLGALMMLAGPKLHPLWQTPLLPLHFLITCVAMGYSIVVFEAAFSSKAFGHRPDLGMMATLQKIAIGCGLGFVAIRFVEITARGQLGAAFRFDRFSVLFWIETLLWILPALLIAPARSMRIGSLVRGAMFIAVAGALYRFDTFLIAFQPGPGWTYFPSVPEIFITIGLVAIELAVYVALVKRFPILSGITEGA